MMDNTHILPSAPYSSCVSIKKPSLEFVLEGDSFLLKPECVMILQMLIVSVSEIYMTLIDLGLMILQQFWFY